MVLHELLPLSAAADITAVCLDECCSLGRVAVWPQHVAGCSEGSESVYGAAEEGGMDALAAKVGVVGPSAAADGCLDWSQRLPSSSREDSCLVALRSCLDDRTASFYTT